MDTQSYGVVPDDVGCCLPLLGQQLRVMHHLLQEGDHLGLQLVVRLKVLERDGPRNTKHRLIYLNNCFTLALPKYCVKTSLYSFYLHNQCKKIWLIVPYKCILISVGTFTGECLDTQCLKTFRTLLVAARLITNSLSPFLWSVGKPAENTFSEILPLALLTAPKVGESINIKSN